MTRDKRRRSVPVDGGKVAKVFDKSGLALDAFAVVVELSRNWISENSAPGVHYVDRKSVHKLGASIKLSPAESIEYFRPANGHPRDTDNVRPVRAKTQKVPVYRLLPASRLGGPDDMYTRPESPEGYTEIPAPSGECLIVQIDGDCMEPKYPSGCYVLIDLQLTANQGLVPGADYYVQLRGEGDGKATFKRYVGPGEDCELFDCINKRKYKKQLKICGLFNAGVAIAQVPAAMIRLMDG